MNSRSHLTVVPDTANITELVHLDKEERLVVLRSIDESMADLLEDWLEDLELGRQPSAFMVAAGLQLAGARKYHKRILRLGDAE